MLTLLALALPLPSQVWIVDQSGGPGTDFTDIPAAIAAASPGDVLLIRSGTYSTVVLDKALTLQADDGAVADVDGLKLESLPVGEHVVLSGLSFSDDALIDDCNGKVWIEDCQVIPPASFGAPPAAVTVRDSADVVVVNTLAIGPSVDGGASAFGGPRPAPGLEMSNSAVHLFECTFEGGNGAYVGGDPGGLDWVASAREGALLDSGELFALSSTFVGGNGYPSVSAYGYGCIKGDGAPGIVMQVPAYLRDSQLVGGLGGQPPWFGGTCPAGDDGPPYTGGPPVEYQGEYVTLDVPSPIRENGAFGVTLTGTPGVQAIVALGTSQDALLIPAWGGGLAVQGPWIVLSPVAIPPAGTITLPLALSDLGPSVESVTYYGQVAALDAFGAFTVNDPTVTVLLDGQF